MRVGIVGGTGKMGAFFKKVWEAEGHQVQVSGRNTACTSVDLARSSDMVVVSVPIRRTVEVIDNIAPILTEGQIFCDLTSLKMKPVEAMLRSSAEVIGLHPMFGPTVASLRGQTVIACPERCSPDTEQAVLGTFINQGARVIRATPEGHDRMMAVIQGLTHFSTLCLAESMRRTGIDIVTALRCTSPVYRIEMGVIGRLLGQDPDLYADILTLNPFIPPVIEELRQALQNLEEVVRRGDQESFRSFFLRNAEAFACDRERATRETDAIIEFLVNS
ncbi:MAG: prephenate dehydrogenase/arogenate dehydrogenase family protein [Methanomicrobiales archaeon]|nr:prephenate dehydrogenase/arogenate dehydrogenase family protein [Methanomicrobiales archaeon]